MSVNLSDVRNHTEIGTGYTKDAMLNKCADEIENQQSRIDDLEKQLNFWKTQAVKLAEYEEAECSRADIAEERLAIAVDALENLIKVKGRHNTEIAYNRCADALTRIKQLQEYAN